MTRKIAVALVAAVAAGLVTGAIGRVLMRFVALATGAPGDFSWVGTLGIVMIFAVAMVPGALLAAFSRRRGRWLFLAAGAALLCVPATGIASGEIGSTGDFSAGQWTGVVAAGLGVYAMIGALPIITLWLIDRVLSPSSASARA